MANNSARASKMMCTPWLFCEHSLGSRRALAGALVVDLSLCLGMVDCSEWSHSPWCGRDAPATSKKTSSVKTRGAEKPDSSTLPKQSAAFSDWLTLEWPKWSNGLFFRKPFADWNKTREAFLLHTASQESMDFFLFYPLTAKHFYFAQQVRQSSTTASKYSIRCKL